MSPQRLLVIDGNSLAHRAFHAIPLLYAKDGTVTNSVYGFTNMLFKVLQKTNPDYLAVAFDKGKITFRHASYAEYKGTRKPTPPELRSQFPLLKEMLSGMRICVLELENYEADDIMGTLVSMAEETGMESIVLTGDKDALQLVSPSVRVLLTKKGISEMEEYDEAAVDARFGVTPVQIIDIKGLMGDSSDNIPGVPGIGEKTAVKLVKEYGSVENTLACAAELTPRWRAKIEEHGDLALLSKQLATIDRQVPLGIDLEQLKWLGPDYSALLDIFSRLEFKTLVHSTMAKINEHKKNGASAEEFSGNVDRIDFKQVQTAADLQVVKNDVFASGQVMLAPVGSREEGIKYAALTAGKGKEVYIISSQQPGVIDMLFSICADPGLEITCLDGKETLWMFHKYDVEVDNISFDLQLADYLLNPSSSQNSVSDLALQYLQLILPTQGEEAAAAKAKVLWPLREILQQKLADLNMDFLYYDVELPLMRVLADMEMTGVNVEPSVLQQMAQETSEKIDALVEEIYQLADEPFNINSPKQLGEILFTKLGLPMLKKTKTGFSTDASVLEELSESHVIVERILTYRQLAKLKSTYIDGLLALINSKSGKIHTSFNQNVTATGRLSSSNPNLQNIPIRLEEGRRIRRFFVPSRKGNLILAADYSQIELRVLAHMSGDPNMVQAFASDQDIHTRTASEVFNIPVDQVTPELRDRAKAVNFGIVYGMSDFGLARDIKVSKSEAGRYIRNYFERYSGVKKFIDRTIAEARDKGYSTTLLNRRRYLPDILSANRVNRAFGERTAINTPIQGSAADIIKLAMVRIYNELRNNSMSTQMILQVHDELIFDVPEDELPAIMKIVREHMENAIQLSVPLKVDLQVGLNWYDLRKV